MDGLIIFAIFLISGMWFNARYGGGQCNPTEYNMRQELNLPYRNWKVVWLGSSVFVIISLIIVYFLERL